MGVSIEVWRARVGTFVQHSKPKAAAKTWRTKYPSMSLIIRTLLFLLLVSQCVESNPGPGSQNGRGRGENKGSGRSSSARRTRHTENDFPDDLSQPITNNLQCSHNERPSQGGLSSWLRSSQRHESADHTNDRDFDISNNSGNTHIDTTTILLEIRSDIKAMTKKFDSLEITVNEFKTENEKLKEQNDKLNSEVQELTTKVNEMDSTMQDCNKNQERLEMHINRPNLKFYNVEDDPNESSDATEQKVSTFIADVLQIPRDQFSFEKVVRLRAKTEKRPILARFSTLNQRDTVLSAFRAKRKKQNLDIRIGEVLPQRIARARSLLYPFFQECINENKNAFFRHDVLVVDGIEYTYDTKSKRPISNSK